MNRIKVFAVMESQTVSGPAKNLIKLAKLVGEKDGDLPGVDVRIATFQRPGAPEDFIKAVRDAGLEISVIPERRALDVGVVSKLRAAIAEYAPDILQTHNIKSHFFVKILGLHRIYPWIAFHHGYTTTDMKMLVYNQLNRYSLRSPRQIVAVCRAFSSDLIKRGVRPERIAVQHNMVEPFVRPENSKLKTFRSELGLRESARVLLCVGRFSREKGHADLIKAVAIIHKELPSLDFQLVLLGDGPERESIRRLSIELGVQPRILLAGYQRDTSPYYAMADVFALPSHSEGSPNALLEAMAAGVPCVATSVGGVPEIAVHEKNALLVARGDSAGLAAAIMRLCADAALREKFVKNGRQVTEEFQPASYRRHMIQRYQKLLKAL